MRIELSCLLPREPDWVWSRIRKSDTLHFVAAPMIKFIPKNGEFPAVWEPGKYDVSMRMFGLIPLGWQTIEIEYPEGDGSMVLRDNGSGILAKKWDHWVIVENENGGTRYSDRIDVSAGLLTPIVALFARFFYAHRQRRWALPSDEN